MLKKVNSVKFGMYFDEAWNWFPIDLISGPLPEHYRGSMQVQTKKKKKLKKNKHKGSDTPAVFEDGKNEDEREKRKEKKHKRHEKDTEDRKKKKKEKKKKKNKEDKDSWWKTFHFFSGKKSIKLIPKLTLVLN